MSHTKTNKSAKTKGEQKTVVIDLDVTVKANTISASAKSKRGTRQTILRIEGKQPFTRHLSPQLRDWTGTIPEPHHCNWETGIAIAKAMAHPYVSSLHTSALLHGDRPVFVCRYQLS